MPIDGPRLKLDRANVHLQSLRDEVRRFIALEPCTFRIDPHPEPPDFVLRGYINRPAPASLGTIIGDFAHNTRSALDVLVHEVSTLPLDDKRRRDLAFVIADDDTAFNKRKAKELNGVRDSHVKIIESFQPYQGEAGDSLALIRDLNNSDKHRVITTVSAVGREASLSVIGVGVGRLNISGGRFTTRGFDIQFVNDREISEDGAVVARIRSDGVKAHMNPAIAVDLQFAGGQDGFAHLSVLEALTSIHQRVTRIVDEFDHRSGPP